MYVSLFYLLNVISEIKRIYIIWLLRQKRFVENESYIIYEYIEKNEISLLESFLRSVNFALENRRFVFFHLLRRFVRLFSSLPFP